MLRAALYGAGAALVAIVTGYEIGLISILVGITVGKAIRRGSHGWGGRPQQILAVALTYFAITSSYIPVAIYNAQNKPAAAARKNFLRDRCGFSTWTRSGGSVSFAIFRHLRPANDRDRLLRTATSLEAYRADRYRDCRPVPGSERYLGL